MAFGFCSLALAAAMIPTSYGILAGVIAAALVSLPAMIRTRKFGVGSQLGLPVRPRHPAIPDPPAVARTPSLIELVRARVGHRPRTFDQTLITYLEVGRPYWLARAKSDDLYPLYAAQQRIRRDGKVAWAAIVQANATLFSPGTSDNPASVIWSEDPTIDLDPRLLQAMVGPLFALKGTHPADPEEAAFAEMLTDERMRGLRLKVPTRIARGRAVFHSSIMFHRKHLPLGYLTGSLFPVWIDPQPTGHVLMVPAAFWPAPLLAGWSRDRRDRVPGVDRTSPQV